MSDARLPAPEAAGNGGRVLSGMTGMTGVLTKVPEYGSVKSSP
jgi:hypothetical protein